jgi:hypothetical protein
MRDRMDRSVTDDAVSTAPLPSASQLMRDLGLLVDGPLRWGAPVPSRAPGVFVIELVEPVAEAPLDHVALRRWLEAVPNLRLDGEQPTVALLARRLASFWLPAEPTVYVGRSSRSIGARVAAIHATPLGDARPAAGGHWLKTLARPERLRTWWAETDAHEEYQDALLSEIAARTDPAVAARLGDAHAVLPFANLETATGEPRRHGIDGALRQPAADATRPTGKPAARPPTNPAPPRRRATPARGPARASPAAARPAPEPT